MAITLPTSSGPDTLTPTTHEEVGSTIEQAQVLNGYATKLYALCENFAATLQEGGTLSDLESRFREGIESLSIRSTKMVDGSPFIAVSGRQRTSQHKRLIGEVIDFLWENIMAPSLKKKNGSDDIYIFEGKKVENRLKSIFGEFIEGTEPHPMIDPKDTLDSAVSANIGALLSNLQYDLRERGVNKMLIEKHTIAWPLLISILAGAAFTMNMSGHAIENLLIEAAVKDPKGNSWLLDETLRSLISYGLGGIVGGTLGYTWHELARSTKAWAKAGIKKTKRNTTRLLGAFGLASALSLGIYGTDYLGTNAGAVKGFHNLNEAQKIGNSVGKMTNPNDPNSATAQLLAATQTNTALAVSSTQGNAKLEVGRGGRGPAAAALEYPMVGTAILRDPKLSDTASPFVAELRSKIVTTDESINTEFPELAQFPTMAGKLAAMQTALKEGIEARVVASLKPIEGKYTLPKDKLPREDQRQKYQASSHILGAQNLQKDLTDLGLWDTVKYVITGLDMGLDATDVLKAQQLLVADLGKIEEYMTKEQARMTKLVGLYNTFSNSLYERANKQYPNTPAITSTSITLPTADLSGVKAIAQKPPLQLPYDLWNQRDDLKK